MTSAAPLLDPLKVARLGRLELIARRVMEGFLRGMHRSAARGSSIEFAEHRPYVPGDEIAQIDWRAYGKTDRLYLKEYEDETNLRITLLLDASGSMAFGTTGVTKFRYASCLGACLGLLMARQQDAVGLIAFDAKIRRLVPPKASAAHLDGLLGEIEGLSPGGETRIGAVLSKAAEAIQRRGLVVLLSDLIDDPRELLKGLSRFRSRGSEVLVFHIVDPAEMEFPFTHWAVFRDPERPGRRIKVDARWVRETYLRSLGDHLDRLRTGCRSGRIDYVLTDTRTPFETALASYLSSRRRRGR